MSARPHIMLLSGEYSGNIYGAALAREIRRLSPEARLTGTGCAEMAEQGVELLADATTWGGIGFIEALRVVPRLTVVFRRLMKVLDQDRPDVLVLIDYPGFNMMLARRAGLRNIPTLFYFPPGKFARRPDEVADAARVVTRIAAPFQFTYDVYREAGADVEFVGHPLADALPTGLTAPEARHRLGLEPGDRLIGLLPGSRRREIRNHTPMLMACARRIAAALPRARFIVPMPGLGGSKMASLTTLVEHHAARARAEGLRIDVVRGQAHDVMVAADVLLIASGTATLEAAWFGTPMVIVYKASWLTEYVARKFFFARLPEHFGLPNIIAGHLAVPEFIQSAFTEDNIAGEALRLLQDPEHRRRQLDELRTLRETIGGPGTSARVAAMALELAGALGREEASS